MGFLIAGFFYESKTFCVFMIEGNQTCISCQMGSYQNKAAYYFDGGI